MEWPRSFPKLPKTAHRGELSQRITRVQAENEPKRTQLKTRRKPSPRAANGVSARNRATAGDETNPLELMRRAMTSPPKSKNRPGLIGAVPWLLLVRSSCLVHDRHRVLDRFDDLADVERLAEEAVEPAGDQTLGLVVGDLPAHRDHLRELKVGIVLHLAGGFAAVDVLQVHVHQDHVRAELLGGYAGGEPALGDFHLVLRLVLEDLLEHLDDVLLVV